LEISVKVELIAIEGCKLDFYLEAHDSIVLISRGWHERHLINKPKFDERVKTKV
jgi:fluoroacetyl-CoA thioesterase